jgi:hypothetical protein
METEDHISAASVPSGSNAGIRNVRGPIFE